MNVTLTWSEMMLAHMVAAERIVMNAKRAVTPRYNSDHSEWKHLVSTRGEIAVAKALNLYWSGCTAGDYQAVDVGGCVQVRAVDKPGRRLILHPADGDTLPFVLADTSLAPVVHLQGWMMGGEGKRPHWWQDPRRDGSHAFFVEGPLYPMSDLVKHFHRDPL